MGRGKWGCTVDPAGSFTKCLEASDWASSCIAPPSINSDLRPLSATLDFSGLRSGSNASTLIKRQLCRHNGFYQGVDSLRPVDVSVW